jgi:hypothetical protein
VRHLRLATTDYGRDATKPWHARLLWLIDHVAAYADAAIAFLSVIGLWMLGAAAVAIAFGWVNATPLGALLLGLWIGFAVMTWTGSLRRIQARSRREMRRQLNTGGYDDAA